MIWKYISGILKAEEFPPTYPTIIFRYFCLTVCTSWLKNGYFSRLVSRFRHWISAMSQTVHERSACSDEAADNTESADLMKGCKKNTPVCSGKRCAVWGRGVASCRKWEKAPPSQKLRYKGRTGEERVSFSSPLENLELSPPAPDTQLRLWAGRIPRMTSNCNTVDSSCTAWNPLPFGQVSFMAFPQLVKGRNFLFPLPPSSRSLHYASHCSWVLILGGGWAKNYEKERIAKILPSLPLYCC